MNMIKKLQKGDLVDIVSPSSPITNEELTNINNLLQKYGLNGRYFDEDKILAKEKPDHQFPISNGKERFEQLQKAINAEDSKAIWCSCGGYGAADTLEFLQQLQPQRQTKLFIGYSDVSNLASFFGKNWGWQTIYGPMLRQLSNQKLDQKCEKAIFELILEGDESFYHDFAIEAKNEAAKNGKIEAKLVGGCLSVIANNHGTRNQIDWQDKLLLLEDIEEKGEKIERLLMQLLSIFEEKNNLPKAIIFGNFTQYIEDEILKRNIATAISNFIKKTSLKYPEVAIFEEIKGLIGHSNKILPLVINKNTVIADKFLLQKN